MTIGLIATEKSRVSNLVKYEQGGQNFFSRDEVVVQSGETVDIGTVLGKITSGGEYLESLDAAVDGSEVASVVAIQNLGLLAADTAVIVIIRNADLSDKALIDSGDKADAAGELLAAGTIRVLPAQPDYVFDV